MSVNQIEIEVGSPVTVEVSTVARPQNVYVGNYTDAEIAAMQLSGPGMVIQTGLGPDGTGIDFWIEDGT